MSYPRSPYIKPKKSCMNPIVVHGIPKFANAIENPKCVGTPDYLKWWSEQIYYIVNEYDAGGIIIPGRYYYYLNFTTFDTVMGILYPHPCDLHLELAYFIDWCKTEHKNGLLPKKRRGGISEAFKIMTVDHGYRFFPGYKAGIAAGHTDYVNDFMEKWTRHDENIISELKIKKLINKKGEIKAGWEVKEADGVREYGTGNSIYARTMGENPGLFKGLYLNDVIAEEMGEFKHSKEFYEATKHCLMMGSVQMGNLWAYGTGDKMDEGMKAFQHMWNQPELYNMERFFIPATRFHFPFYGGAKDEHGNLVEIMPNFQHLTPTERIGVEDIKAAEESILKVRELLTKTGDTQALIKECQNNPLDVNEVFRRTISNHFDVNILNEVGMRLQGETAKYTKYKLVPKKNNEGEFIMPLQIELVPAKDKDDESECILIADDCHYLQGSHQLYCAGIDSYDLDQSKTSKSLGAMVVYVRDNNYPKSPAKKIAALIRCRPKNKETFYNMCMYLSVYYNLMGSVLVDIRNGVIIRHFEENNCKKYLAKRPRKFERENSEQKHEVGVALTGYSKPRMISLLQTYVANYGLTIPFIKIVEELKNYDEQEEGSDNDSVDALGIALMQDATMSSKPLNDDEKKKRDARFNVNEEDYEAPSNPSQDHDRFGY